MPPPPYAKLTYVLANISEDKVGTRKTFLKQSLGTEFYISTPWCLLRYRLSEFNRSYLQLSVHWITEGEAWNRPGYRVFIKIKLNAIMRGQL